MADPQPQQPLLERLRTPWSDRRAERVLGALSSLVLLTILAMIVFVFAKAWPSFTHNGLHWFGGGGNVDAQLTGIFNSPAKASQWDYTFHAWPLIWATILTTGAAVLFGLVFSLFAAIFIVEFAPPRVRAVVQPVVRLLAAVPSVIYGLIGILVIVPFVSDHLIGAKERLAVAGVIQLNGAGLFVSVLILTIMITPIMIAINVDALTSVPRGWREGAIALGVNRWRAMWTVTVHASRPAIIAGAVLATARALGEAIMLAMVSGSTGFAPNPVDGLTFFFEPLRTLAATIIDNAEGLSVKPFGETIYAIAAVLLVSSFMLSFAGWAAKQPMKKYGVRV
ncbi:MAG: phosphate transport system permease protein [Solirubrobacteraceae bacterium]|nr:phosphate transport system permease protein [Solirubrobacteraceae bacterium]